jgi:type IV pilus assembly protein PilB
MRISDNHLKRLLVPPGHVEEAEFLEAEKAAREQNRGLSDYLLDNDYIKDEELGQLIAAELGVPFINLRNEKIDQETMLLVPEPVARKQGIIAFGRDKESVRAATTDLENREMLHILEKKYGVKVKPYFITDRDLKAALLNYRQSIDEDIAKELDHYGNPAIAKEDRDQAVVNLVNLLVEHAHYSHASDIHIEPYLKAAIVRLRIDSVMHKISDLPPAIMPAIVQRIKVLAGLRTDEHQAAQDGRFQHQASGEKVDIRVSVVPVAGGENVVMRLLSASARQISLAKLGLSEAGLKTIKQSTSHPHGMILSTGPTGSGKTSTLYAILDHINSEDVHIATIEDPIEYDMPGVSQIQVNKKTNLSFAEGLRAIVRQDPDIIMVGEIRDEETADIAINSAMTGHLVLSTLHTNDAVTTLPRLIDMGIEPYLIVSSINLIIAQRLVRKICAKCRASYTVSQETADILRSDEQLKAIIEKKIGSDLRKATFFKGEGCKVCANTGYSGRIGIFELLTMNEPVKELVLNRAASNEIRQAAVKSGMATMFEDGLDKAGKGITTIDEVIRVSRT